jgi:ATP-binding cassette, subfamily B, multidrug efflux pump
VRNGNNKNPGFGFLRPYAVPYARPFFAAVLFLSVEAACDLMQPTIMARVIDVGIAGRDSALVLSLGALMLAIAGIGAVAAIVRNVISSRVSQRFGADLRTGLYRTIHSFSFADLDRFETPSLITRLTNDVTQVQNFVNGTMRIFVKAPLLAAGGIVMALSLDAGMAPVLLAVVPVAALLIAASVRTGYPLFRGIQATLDRVNSFLREYLSGVRVVKAFNRFGYEEARFGAANAELCRISTRATRVMSVFSPAIALAVNSGIVAVLWIGGARVSSGEMRIGQVVAFVNYMIQILSSLMMISFIFNAFVRARASAERIGEVMAGAKSLPVLPRPGTTVRQPGALAFEDVTFSYGGEGGSVLRGINFRCAAGETIGVIGPTGAGKSALALLIPRFYDASSGTVRVGGEDVRSREPRELRERIALVPQRTFLFTGTILGNILWGRNDVDPGRAEEEAAEAAEIAEADEFIRGFPEGYGTLVGRGGVNLSGGQKQRIAIARALVRKPEILILDDAASAVDTVTEAKIRRSLRERVPGATTVVIAQRIASVMGADRILVLDDGAAVGYGTHRELLSSCGVYREIYRSQIDGDNDRGR